MSLHPDTAPLNIVALERVATDPLAEVAGVPAHPEARADGYRELGCTFLRRGMHERAVATPRRAEALHLTEAGALRLESYERSLRQTGEVR